MDITPTTLIVGFLVIGGGFLAIVAFLLVKFTKPGPSADPNSPNYDPEAVRGSSMSDGGGGGFD